MNKKSITPPTNMSDDEMHNMLAEITGGMIIEGPTALIAEDSIVEENEEWEDCIKDEILDANQISIDKAVEILVAHLGGSKAAWQENLNMDLYRFSPYFHIDRGHILGISEYQIYSFIHRARAFFELGQQHPIVQLNHPHVAVELDVDYTRNYLPSVLVDIELDRFGRAMKLTADKAIEVAELMIFRAKQALQFEKEIRESLSAEVTTIHDSYLKDHFLALLTTAGVTRDSIILKDNPLPSEIYETFYGEVSH